MPIVFPRENNIYFPLPSDYPTLSKDGKRKARVNAASLGGRPDLEVASWHFFRETYLIPQGLTWYRNDYTPSPDSHYKWIYDWYSNDRLIHAAPRGTCKTTVNLEDILKKITTNHHWECALFLATQNFAADRLGRLMDQIESNPLIIEDFGKLKIKRGSGRWNRGSCMELTNGSRVNAIPITGASLGSRPSGLLVLDDVEKSDDLVKLPSDLRENFERFFFNALYPMANSPGKRIPMRVIGTLYHRRMFIYWLYSTEDKRVSSYFTRILMDIDTMDWNVFDKDWKDRMILEIGLANFNAQYMNAPGTEAEHILQIHPELCTYWLEDLDQESHDDPLNSKSLVISHNLIGYKDEKNKKEEPVPIPNKIVREFGDVIQGMRRFICVDSAKTTTELSDFSVVHVMGFENTSEHRDTLWSLDLWRGKVRNEELVRTIYQMAQKWQVNFIGVEAYAVYSTFFEMCRDALPSMYGKTGRVPRVMPLTFPTKYSKEDKLMGLEWRFRQYRVKLPLHAEIGDSNRAKAYRRLRHEIENFTEDMALLDHDDVIDTLAMHQAIGKQHQAVAPDIYQPVNLIEKLLEGNYEECGVPLMSGININDLTETQLRELMNRNYDEQVEEAGFDPEDYMNQGYY